MRLVDRALPAAKYLIGADAIGALRLPVEAGGGVIESVHPVQIQYRPGADVVVRYSAQVSWSGAPAKRETLIAASAVNGTHPGTVPIMADTPDGAVEIGVWRWPFDPVLVGLSDVVSAAWAADVLGLSADDLGVEVVAYRPTDRAVIRVGRGADAVAYIKVVAPNRVAAITQRHEALLAAGVPVAAVTLSDADRGLVGLDALQGDTLRDLIKADAEGWPDAAEFGRVADALSLAEIEGAGPASRIADGPLHARMLAAVMPESATLLERLASRFEDAGDPAVDGVVHGDLHEGQLIVGGGRIVGVLDVDDVGPGASIDDSANLIARIRYRAATTPAHRARLDAYASAIRAGAIQRQDPGRLDVHTAAALVGLATGPFRIQAEDWRHTVIALLDEADELSMRELSA